MKFARAATGRPRLLSCDGGYHGVTIGPLSLVGDEFFKEGFEPLLPGCGRVPFGDLDALEAELRTRDVAAFITEPIQGNLVRMPPAGYLQGAQELCRRYGTLFAVDEVQTGLGRTGTMFALDRYGLEPDFVTIGKALSGGYMPVSAMVTRREIFQRAVGTLERCFVHQSTYGRNRLSMAAGLASLRIIERDGLVDNAERMGTRLMDGLCELGTRYEMVADVRGSGLIVGVELGPPSGRTGRLNWRLIHMASGGLFPQLIVIPLHRDHRVITMAGGKNDVIKLLPALTISEREVDTFLERFEQVLADVHGPASHNWGVVRDIATATLTRRSRGAADGALPAVMPPRGRRLDPSSRQRLPGDRRDRIHRWPARPSGCLTRVTRSAAWCVPRSDTRAARRAAGRDRVRRPDRRGLAVTRGRGLPRRRALRRAGVGLGHDAAADRGQRARHPPAAASGGRRVGAAVRAPVVDRRLWLSATRGRRALSRRRISQLVLGDQARRPSSRSSEHSRRRALQTVILRPATVYGPGSVELIGELDRAIRGRYMVLIDGGHSIAGLVYIDNLLDAAMLALSHDDAPSQAFNVTDGLDVTWRQFTDGLAGGLGAPPVRFSLPYAAAAGIGRTLEGGYRTLRRATSRELPPLLSRQAVHTLGLNQAFSNRKARDVLGWEPRVGYEDGLRRTVQWLLDGRPAAARSSTAVR